MQQYSYVKRNNIKYQVCRPAKYCQEEMSRKCMTQGYEKKAGKKQYYIFKVTEPVSD